MKLIGHEAIQYAADKGLTLNKYADPIEDAQAGLSIERAEAVAAEDPGLIWVDCRELLRTEFEHAGETYLAIVWECPEAPRDGRSGNATVYRVGKVGVCSYRASGIYAAPDLEVEDLDDATHEAARQALNRMHTRDDHCVLRKLSPYASIASAWSAT